MSSALGILALWALPAVVLAVKVTFVFAVAAWVLKPAGRGDGDGGEHG